MVNIAILLGNGPIGEDSFRMGPWTKYIVEKHNLFVISRISEEAYLSESLKKFIGDDLFLKLKIEIKDLKERSNEYLLVYDSPYFQKDYTNDEIEELQSWLGISYSYISSLDRRFYDKKKMKDVRNEKELYIYMAALTNIYRDFFVKNEIEVFINSLEDITFSVLAYYVAKKLDVTVLGFVSSRFPKKGMLFCKDFSELCIHNKNNVEWDEINSLYSNSLIVREDLIEKNKKFFQIFSINQRVRDLKKFLNYKKFVNNSIKCYPHEKFIFEPTSALKEFKNYLIKFIRVSIIKYFEKKLNETDKYFFYPIHYMEDAQVTFREPHLDQIDLIKKISRSLPFGYFLYVKAHPHYLGSDIKLNDLFKLNKLKNVKLISPTAKPIDLIKNSKGVITVNSTTGFESLIQNKPVITFGHDIYCRDDLCYVIRDINKLSDTIMKIIDRKFEGFEAKEFIKSVYANTIWIDGFGPTFESCGLMDDDGYNVAKSLDIIISKID